MSFQKGKERREGKRETHAEKKAMKNNKKKTIRTLRIANINGLHISLRCDLSSYRKMDEKEDE